MSIPSQRPKRSELVEKLAAIEHDRWSHWQRYLHEKGKIGADGSLLISADLVQRWKRQYETSFCKLSDSEKQSDREQVERYLDLIIDHVEKFLDKG